MKTVSIAVIGNGRWARALSVRLKHNQKLWRSRIRRAMLYQPPPDLPRLATFAEPSEMNLRVPVFPTKKTPSAGGDETLQMTADALMFAAGEVYADSIDIAELRDADILVLAVPASKVKPLLKSLAGVLTPEQAIVHAIGSFAPVEGAGRHSMLPVSELIKRETPLTLLGVLAGPALAEDLEEDVPVALVCGSAHPEVGALLHQALHGPHVRLYTSSDLIGVEVARALVGVYCFAIGVAEAMELGPAVRSLLIARGSAEMGRLAAAFGGQDKTLQGPAGLGELVVATERRGSPDFQLGKLIGKGASLGEAARQIDRACDALNMIREGHMHAQRLRINLPIVQALYRWVGGRHDLRTSVTELIEKELFLV
jgi:glycerol-3-phosphate dehydrogenase (NAD(P)+)